MLIRGQLKRLKTRPRQAPQNKRKVPIWRSNLPQRTGFPKATKQPRYHRIGSKIHTNQGEDMFKGHPVPFDRQNRQPKVMARVQKELSYLLNRGFARSDILSTTPTKELGPFRLVEDSCEVPEVCCCDLRNRPRKAILSNEPLDNFQA